MRKKHIPMRTCVGCRTTRPKRDLIRIVRNPEGQVELDLTGKRSGRGAYLCPSEECLGQAIAQRQLERALQLQVSNDIIMDLKKVLREQVL